MVGRLQKLALRIPRPLLRKQRNCFIFRDLGSWVHILASQGCIQSDWKVALKAERQVSHLCGSGIDFDQVRIPRVRLQHEIETVQPGKL